jgi:hypothetical protein
METIGPAVFVYFTNVVAGLMVHAFVLKLKLNAEQLSVCCEQFL